MKTLEKLRKRAKSNNKGFSLVELIIVIAIMAVLVGILAPQYLRYVEKSRVAADDTNIEELKKAFEVIATDNSLTDGVITINTTGTEVTGTKSKVTIEDELLKIMPTYKTTKLSSKKYATKGATITYTVDATDPTIHTIVVNKEQK